MKIGIISDTHNNHKNVKDAIEIFNTQKTDYVLHAGDMTSSSTAKLFAGLRTARFIAICGNCDTNTDSLQSSIEDFAGRLYKTSYSGKIAGRQIFMTHKPDQIDTIIQNGSYDLVIYGHTHRQDIRKKGKTTIINPGAARNWFIGQPQVIIFELDDMSHQAIGLRDSKIGIRD